MKRLDHYWYSLNPIALLLAPLAWLFCLLVRLRMLAYRRGWAHSRRFAVPLIVVGNIAVGGSGKTPLVIWLAQYLREHGYRPGIVSRGYGGTAKSWPLTVTADSDPDAVGDEPVLIARRSACPMAVGPDRVAAVELLLRDNDCDVVISDDGMQHYRLARDIEIAVIDGVRRHGNGLCLPAGPLREPRDRLRRVALTVANGPAAAGEFSMTLLPTLVRNLYDGSQRALDSFRGQRVHAVAGIGHPGRFFATLRAHGIEPVERPFPDHHRYRADDIHFGDPLPVLMTEKDAVKCAAYAERHHWAVVVDAQLPEAFGTNLLRLLTR